MKGVIKVVENTRAQINRERTLQAKRLIKELIKEASRLGEEERARLGRELTEAEAIILAKMFEAQFKMALAVIRLES